MNEILIAYEDTDIYISKDGGQSWDFLGDSNDHTYSVVTTLLGYLGQSWRLV